MSVFRTDKHRNPTAFIVELAKEAGLELDKDYHVGDPFNVNGHTYHTAYIIGDILETTLKVIDKCGFYTKGGYIRWIYIGMPKWVWDKLDKNEKKTIIAFMYKHEGGTEMNHIFA